MTNDAPSDAELRRLVETARDHRTGSYAPYSKFRAGAAVLLADGSTMPGVIVENVSLGLAMCAERVALFSAVAAGAQPVALALVAPATDGKQTWPCGACLQVALELGGPEMPIAVGRIDGEEHREIGVATVAELLPRGPHRDR